MRRREFLGATIACALLGSSTVEPADRVCKVATCAQSGFDSLRVVAFADLRKGDHFTLEDPAHDSPRYEDGNTLYLALTDAVEGSDTAYGIMSHAVATLDDGRARFGASS